MGQRATCRLRVNVGTAARPYPSLNIGNEASPSEIVASFRSSNQASAIGAPLLLEGDFQPATVEEAKTVEGVALQSPATCAAVARLNRHKTLLGNGQAGCH